MHATTRMSGEERRVQILEAALDEFAEHGFNGARTKDMAQRAGISETLIFRHFKNKQELYQAALAHLYHGHPLHEDMRGPLEREADEELFLAVALHMIEHVEKDPRIVRLHLFQALESQSVSMAHHAHEDQSEEVLARYIKHRMDKGVFKQGDAVLAARSFHYLVFMAVADKQMGLMGEPLDLDGKALASQLCTVFLHGLAAE